MIKYKTKWNHLSTPWAPGSWVTLTPLTSTDVLKFQSAKTSKRWLSQTFFSCWRLIDTDIKKKNPQKTLVLFWSTVALLKKEVLVPRIHALLLSFRPVVFAILWASKTALVSSIIIYLRKESFLTDIQHFKNSLKSRRQSLFYHYSLLLLSQISSFLRFHIY